MGDMKRDTRDGRQEKGEWRREKEDRRWKMGKRRMETGNGRQEMGDGRREMGDGRWEMEMEGGRWRWENRELGGGRWEARCVARGQQGSLKPHPSTSHLKKIIDTVSHSCFFVLSMTR